MLSWVVKVVPQPPEPTPKKIEEQKEQKPAAALPVPEKKVKFQDQCKTEDPKAGKANQEAQVAEENSPASGSQPSVLTWISGALPQPAVSPKLGRTSSTTMEENAAARKGMIAWIAEGLEKVVPHPDLKSKESPPAEPPAEVCKKAAAPAAEPQVTVVEVESDQEDNTDNKPFPPRMIYWIKQGIEKVVPQPEIHVRATTEEKSEAPASAKAPSPQAPPAPKPAADTDKSFKEAEQQPNMMGWIANEIGRMLPQPVQKQDGGSDEVQNRGKCSKSPLK